MTKYELLTVLGQSLALDGIESMLAEEENPVLVLKPDSLGEQERTVQMELSVLNLAGEALHLQILSVLAEDFDGEAAESVRASLNQWNMGSICGGYLLLPDGALVHRHVASCEPDRWLETTAAALEAVLQTLDAQIDIIFQTIL